MRFPVFKELNPDDPEVSAPTSSPPGRRTDEQLMAAYRGGDRNSFVELVSRYEKELFHFLARFLGDRTTAEDIFQETFLQVHQSASTFDPERRFRPWLFTIAANKARDQIDPTPGGRPAPCRRTSIPATTTAQFIDLIKSVGPSPDQPMEESEMRTKVKEAVMAMPDNLREILLLSYFQQFPYKEIGTMLKIPLGTVKSRLHAAVAHFAQNWRAANPDRSPS